DSCLHLSRHVRVVEFVGAANQFGWLKLQELATERMTVTGREIGERHFVRASDLGVEMMHLAGESIRRQPFDHGLCIKECAVNSLRRGAQDAVESNRVCIACRHLLSLLNPVGATLRGRRSVPIMRVKRSARDGYGGPPRWVSTACDCADDVQRFSS